MTEKLRTEQRRTPWRPAKSLAPGSLTLFVTLSIANGSNYLFHVVVSRMLGPSAYGGLAALLAAFLVVSILAGAVQLTVARLVAQAPGDAATRGAILHRAAGGSWAMGALAGAVALVLAPFLAPFLHLSLPAALMLAAYTAPSFPAAAFQGGLQGATLFGRLAVAVIVPTILRLVVGIVLVRAGLGVAGAAGASAVAQAALVILGWRLLHDKIPMRADPAVPTRPLAREAGWFAATLSGFWVLASIDTVLARHYLSAHDSGLYGASVTLSRSALFASTAIALIAFPRFASLAGERGRLRRSVIHTSAVVGAVGVAVAAVVGAVPELAMRVLFGGAYEGGAPIVRLLSVTMIALSMGMIFLYAHLAIRARSAFVFWVAAAVEAVAVVTFHASAVQIAGITVAIAAAVVAFQLSALPRG